MKLLALFGSPNRKGNTAALLNAFLEGAEDREGVEVEFINLQEKDIKPCKACRSCRQSPYLKCAINDDMQHLHKKVIGSDIVVFATPIYWWNVSAQLKLFIDRLYALAGQDRDYKCLHGKKIVILMTYAGSDPNSGAKLVEEAFKDIAEYLKMEIVGILGVCSGAEHVQNNDDALNEAFKLGQQVILK